MGKIPPEDACAAISADIKRFPEGADFDHWCSYPALTVEEITALSLEREPEVLNPKRIEELGLTTPHPRLVETREDLLGMSAIANAFNARRNFLLRACRHGDLHEHAKPVGDTYELRLLDFLDWFRRADGNGPWDWLPIAFAKCVKAFHGANADTGKEEAPSSSVSEPAPPAQPDTGKGKAGLSSLGVLKDKKGVVESWKLMRSEMSKARDKRKFKTMKKLQAHCEDELGIGYHDFQKVRKLLNSDKRLIPYKPGAPSKPK